MSPKQYQIDALPGVSRTFALTIPQLPEPLREVVTNAYLLCRIADTIEDDPGINSDNTHRLHEEFVSVVQGESSAESFAEHAQSLLSDSLSREERDLISNTDLVVAVTDGFKERDRAALIHCVRIMCNGMPGFQKNKDLGGLSDVATMNRYCYFVAGVVGEMLTEIFCSYSTEIDRNHDQLMQRAVFFGQGLQMTNIIKDLHDDREAGSCWLPSDVFERAGFNLENLRPGCDDPAFAAGLDELIGIAIDHLRHALDYTLMIPKHEKGIRRFCLWAIGLAVLTLKKVWYYKTFSTGTDVKVSRRTVRAVVLATRLANRSDALLNFMFNAATAILPKISRDSEAAPTLTQVSKSPKLSVNSGYK